VHNISRSWEDVLIFKSLLDAILTVDQKQQRVNVCEELHRPPMTQPSCPGLLLVTRAGFTVTTLRQRNKRKVRTRREQSQEHAHHFLYIKGIVRKQILLADQTANLAYYCEVFR
jgi:hypothetical protein